MHKIVLVIAAIVKILYFILVWKASQQIGFRLAYIVTAWSVSAETEVRFQQPSGFFRCFDAVGWVIYLV